MRRVITVAISEARVRFGRVLDAARAGTEVRIARHGRLIARMFRPSPKWLAMTENAGLVTMRCGVRHAHRHLHAVVSLVAGSGGCVLIDDLALGRCGGTVTKLDHLN